MKKIAIISPSYYPNIWNMHGRSTFSIAYGLAKKGYDISVFTFTDRAETYRQQDGQVTVHYVGGVIAKGQSPSLPLPEVGLWNERLLPILLKEKWDILICNNWHGAEAAIKYKQAKDAKLIGIVPFLYSFTGFLKPMTKGLTVDIKEREATFLHYSDALVCHTEKFGKRVSEYINKEVNIIPNSYLNITELIDTKIKKVPYQVCSIGRLNREKSLERVIRVMPHLPDMQLVIACPESSVSYFPSLVKLAKEFDVDHRLTFKGWMKTKEVRELYKQSACAVIPSMFEPYGYGAIDPMSLEVPLVFSEWSFLDEYTGNVTNCFNSLDSLSDKLAAVLYQDQSAVIAENKTRVNTMLAESAITGLFDYIL